MAISVAIWSIAASPDAPTVITPPGDIRITNIALGEELADESGRTTVKLMYRLPGSSEKDSDDEDEEDEDEDEEEKVSTTVLCSLTPGKIEQCTLDVVLAEDEEYLIEVAGKNTVFLTGNYIDQNPFDQDPYGDEDMSDEEDFDLQDVSSDVEVNPDELDIPSDDEERFEEINEAEASKSASKTESKKRPRESDATETAEQEGKLSKSQQKKQKKLKAENGEPVAVASPEKTEDKKSKQDKKKAEKEKEKPKAEAKTLAGGLKLVDHKTGTGPQAKAGDMVSMRYIGKLENGKVFDQNTKGKPFKFRLGKGEVIKGWDVGIVGMQVGGERLLTIPAPMAYGKKAQSGIPANSTLIFEVKLLGIN